MSALGWSLARLRAMPPDELLHRGRIALRDRLAPPAWRRWPAREAFGRLFDGEAAAIVRDSPLRALARADLMRPETIPATLAAAQALGEGRWALFGRDVALGDPPLWDRDPMSGVVWPDVPVERLDYRSGAPKPVWELGRLTLLPTLALAARVTGDRSASMLAARWLDDWTSRHALGHGIHMTSGIEMAIRVLTVSWTLMLADEPAAALEPTLGLLAQQTLHLRDHLSLGSSANNHLIAEYAAMAVMGRGFPALREGRMLAGAGLGGLERETLRQIHADGVPAEQAFGYQPFVWELLLAGLLAGEATGRPASPAVRERLARSLEFARAIRLPDGRWPRVGDEDDGRVFLASETASRLDLVGNALAAWLDVEGLAPGGNALALLLTGRAPDEARAAGDGRYEFPDGGYTVWRERGLHLLFDHGPLGLGTLAAHGHADALSVTVQRGDDAVVVDSGTLAYQEDPAAREKSRATRAHATIAFGGRSQSESLGPFLWGRRAEVRADGDGWACAWPDGARHWRRVTLEGGTVVIEDRVQGPGAELVFPIAPGVRTEIEGTVAHVHAGETVARIAAEGIGAWRLEPIEVALGFGRRVPSFRLVARLAAGACTTRITAAPR